MRRAIYSINTRRSIHTNAAPFAEHNAATSAQVVTGSTIPVQPLPSNTSTSIPTPTSILTHARTLLAPLQRVLVLTGAGISTESGVPDYRSPGRPPHRPTSHQQFMAAHATRQRYWARSLQGYFSLSQARPNGAHYALSYAQRVGKLAGIVTQNVDGLHEASGSSNVLHLHGTIEKVRCMSCDATHDRAEMQHKLSELNAAFAERVNMAMRVEGEKEAMATSSSASLSMHPSAAPTTSASASAARSTLSASISSTLRPDGDTELSHIDYSQFIVPSCPSCTDGWSHMGSDPDRSAGILKPDLVFFGANVPSVVHAQADRLLESCDGLLIVGTSLTVWSAFRLVRQVFDQVAPGHSMSAVQLLAEQIKNQSNPAASLHVGNRIADGATTLSPVTHLSIPLSDSSSSSSSRRVASALPIVLINRGPTRADPLLGVCDPLSVAKIDDQLASVALQEILDVPMDLRVKHRPSTMPDDPTLRLQPHPEQLDASAWQEQQRQHFNQIQAAMKQHANIE